MEKKLLFLCFGIFFAATTFSTNLKKSTDSNIVVVLSMDAFRWDYKYLIGTPNLDRIAAEGVSTELWQSSFPTITFPNHYAMATGLYPNNHGIVHNTFFSNEYQIKYNIADRTLVQDGKFYKGEPIWNTATKQGVRTASFFWVGSEADIQGMRPHIWKPFDSKILYETRIDSVLTWLQLPEKERPRLIMLYFEDPDGVSHHDNPVNGEYTTRTVKRCDSLAGVLFDNIKKMPHAKRIHLVIVSDHGMCPVAQERSEYLSDYIKPDWVNFSNTGNPVCLMTIKENKLDSAILMLNKAEHLTAYRNSQIPERLHYGSNPDIGNLVIVSDSAWNILSDRTAKSVKGVHGFDNLNKDMYGIFYGYGRDFKMKHRVDVLPNIQLYNIICRLLNLSPVKNDADASQIETLFK